MPCTAKKFESIRPELKIKNMFPVDYVLTTREFAWMLKKNGINFLTLGKSKADNPFGEYSGAAAIYGGSGGVMESALRTAQFLAGKNKKNTKIKLEFQSVRGLKEVKEARVNVAGKELNVAVVSGIGNIEPVIENLDKYNYIEVMACPGGCIGGGGQPAPTTDKIRKKRMEALYKIDSDKKMRKAHENKNVLGILKWLKNEKNCLEHKVLHTSYKKRK